MDYSRGRQATRFSLRRDIALASVHAGPLKALLRDRERSAAAGQGGGRTRANGPPGRSDSLNGLDLLWACLLACPTVTEESREESEEESRKESEEEEEERPVSCPHVGYFVPRHSDLTEIRRYLRSRLRRMQAGGMGAGGPSPALEVAVEAEAGFVEANTRATALHLYAALRAVP
jgi:hypothetical protein